MIQKDGLNFLVCISKLELVKFVKIHFEIQRDSKRWTQFLSLYFKIRTSDKYDVNCI